MLELVEPFIDLTKHIRTRQDAMSVLEKLCVTFGFRTAVVMEFTPDLQSILDYLDTDELRRPRWKRAPNPESMRRSLAAVKELIEIGQLVQYDDSRFRADDPHRQLVKDLDLLDGMSIPITQQGGVAGAMHLSGLPPLTDAQKNALQVIAYLLFVSFRNLHSSDTVPVEAVLTPREREVMVQTSLGFTSPEIADRLGMAERTVNQHIENVAYKFRTKNRLHTVASLLRLNMLD